MGKIFLLSVSCVFSALVGAAPLAEIEVIADVFHQEDIASPSEWQHLTAKNGNKYWQLSLDDGFYVLNADGFSVFSGISTADEAELLITSLTGMTRCLSLLKPMLPNIKEQQEKEATELLMQVLQAADKNPNLSRLIGGYKFESTVVTVGSAAALSCSVSPV